MIRPEIVSSIRTEIEKNSGPLPKPKLSYWLCGTPRTGSNLLRYALKKARCGDPVEGYHKYANRDFGWGYDETDFIQYNRQMIQQQATPKSHIFGLKIFWEHFQYFLTQCEQPGILNGETLTPHEKAAIFFPELHFIFIRRKNKIRQAISLVKAKQSSAFVLLSEQDAPSPNPGKLRYSSKMISYYLDLFTSQEALWIAFFNQGNLTPKTIWFEDFEDQYEDQVKAVIQFLGREPKQIVEPKSKKQADALTEEWYQRYLSENQWIEYPEDAAYLLANRLLRSLRTVDGEVAVSPAIWRMRIKRLATNPRQFLKRLRVK